MEINKLPDAKKCTGCMACMNICPRDAIHSAIDEKGFEYPVIDQNLCVHCNLCTKICPITNSIIAAVDTQQTYYAVKHKEDQVRMNSSSGGIFTWLSDFVLKQEGVVYGSAINEKLQVTHVRATTAEQRDRMRGSKYVQSSMGFTMRQIKEDVLKDKWVLFSGTPCQCAGVVKYLGILAENEKFITMDFICEGVPSPKILDDVKKRVSEKYGGEIKNYYFRDKYRYNFKNRPIPSRCLVFEMKNEQNINYIYDEKINRRYLDNFFVGVLQRSSCGQCQYSSFERVTDFTCGDFFRYDNKNFVDERGVSQLLINTPKGEKIWNMENGNLFFEQCLKKQAVQTRLVENQKKYYTTDLFWSLYQKFGFWIASVTIMPRIIKVSIRKKIIRTVHWIRKRIRRYE